MRKEALYDSLQSLREAALQAMPYTVFSGVFWSDGGGLYKQLRKEGLK